MAIFNKRYLLIIGIAVHLLYLFSLTNGLLNEFFYDSSHFQKGQAGDFFVFYNASRLLLNNQSIYGPKADETPAMYSGYTYIPTFIFLIFWLGFFRPFHAYIIWVLIIELCLFISIYMSVKWKNRMGLSISDQLLVFLWLIPSPFYLELFMGQNTFIFSFFIFLYLMSKDLYNNRAMEYICFSMSIISKIASIIFCPILIRKKQYLLILIPMLIVFLSSAFYFLIMDKERTTVISEKKSEEQREEYALNDKRRYKMPMISRDQTTQDTVVINFPIEFNASIPKGMYITFHHIARKPKTLYYPQVPGFSSLFYQITGSMSLFRNFSLILWFAVFILLFSKPVDYLLDFTILIFLFFLTFTFVWEHHYSLLIPFIIMVIIREKKLRPPLLISYMLISLPTPFFLYNPAFLGYFEMEGNLIKGLLYYLPKSLGIITGFSALIYIKFSKHDPKTPCHL